ncbi:ST8SIA2 [Branchiostoma lanceolatum]|uniref:ST8SIA2 protein n=1 Tax=Branchiostoma lanceolatum TaxID=7740 RepID=A0A8K0EW10_BRALA|nr:ST8SIA2 [Branchiostoma lanceolatum]
MKWYVPSVVPRLSCPACRAPPVVPRLSCPACRAPPVVPRLSCPACRAPPVVPRLSCPACRAPPVVPRLSWPGSDSETSSTQTTRFHECQRLEVPTKPARDKNAPVESSRSSPKPFSPVGSATSFNAEELRRIRSRFKLSENSVEGPSHLYVHVPINATTTPKQRQSWTKYLMIRNALERFFNPKVRMVRATTPSESLERCRKDPAKGKGCPAITPIRHYSTCALVGNSGILLNSSCGNKIDSNDFVIRFNLGPLQDYSKDVGRNVNMTVINGVIVKKLFPMLRENKTSEIVNLLRPFNNSILLLAKGSYSTTFLAECKSMENIMRGRGLNLTIALSNFNGTGTDKRLWAGLGGKLRAFPTTGLLLLGEAITFCDHVTMFGFYPFDHDRQNHPISYHYWKDFTAITSQSKARHGFVLDTAAKLDELPHDQGSYSTKFLAECKSMENIMRGRGLNFTIALSNFNGTGTDKRLWAGLGGKLKSVPTTGLLLLGEVITFCDHVTMFGFYPFDHDRQNRTIPYHYWRDLTAFPSKNKTKHQFVLEYKLLAGLKKDGIIDYTEDCRVIDETKEVTGNFLEGTKEHTRPHLLRKD